MIIILEEICSQEFEVPDGTTPEQIREMYKDTTLLMDNSRLTQLNVLMGEDEGWYTLI